MKLLASWIWEHVTGGAGLGSWAPTPFPADPTLEPVLAPPLGDPQVWHVFDRLLVRKKWFCFSSSFLLPLFPLFPNRLHLLWSLSLSSICYSALVCSQNVQPSSGHKSSQTCRTMSARKCGRWTPGGVCSLSPSLPRSLLGCRMYSLSWLHAKIRKRREHSYCTFCKDWFETQTPVLRCTKESEIVRVCPAFVYWLFLELFLLNLLLCNSDYVHNTVQQFVQSCTNDSGCEMRNCMWWQKERRTQDMTKKLFLKIFPLLSFSSFLLLY